MFLLNRCKCLAAVCAIWSASGAGWALELHYGAEVGASHETNPGLAPDDADGDTADTAFHFFGELGATSRSASYLADVRYRIESIDYQDNIVDDTTRVTGAATVDFYLVPRRLYWHFSNVRSEVGVDPLQPNTPENSETAVSYTTGPVAQFDITRRNVLGLQYLVNRTTAGDDFDVDRGIAIANLTHELSSNKELMFLVQHESIDFNYDTSADDTETRLDYVLGADIALGTTDFYVNAGTTEIERPEFIDENLSHEYLLFLVSRDLNSTTELSFQYTNLLSDSSREVTFFQNPEFEDITDFSPIGSFGRPEYFERQSMAINLEKEFANLQRLRITVENAKIDYLEDVILNDAGGEDDLRSSDQDLLRTSISYTMPLSRSFLVRAVLSHQTSEFDEVLFDDDETDLIDSLSSTHSRTDDDTTLSLQIDKNLSRTLQLRFNTSYQMRSVDADALSVGNTDTAVTDPESAEAFTEDSDNFSIGLGIRWYH